MKYLYLLLVLISTTLTAQTNDSLIVIDRGTITLSQALTVSGSRMVSHKDSVVYDTTEVAAFIYTRKYTKLVQSWVQDTTLHGRYSMGTLKTEEVPTFIYTQEILYKVTKTTYRWAPAVVMYSSDGYTTRPVYSTNKYEWRKVDSVNISYYNYKWEVVPTKLIFAKVDIDE